MKSVRERYLTKELKKRVSQTERHQRACTVCASGVRCALMDPLQQTRKSEREKDCNIKKSETERRKDAIGMCAHDLQNA